MYQQPSYVYLLDLLGWSSMNEGNLLALVLVLLPLVLLFFCFTFLCGWGDLSWLVLFEEPFWEDGGDFLLSSRVEVLEAPVPCCLLLQRCGPHHRRSLHPNTGHHGLGESQSSYNRVHTHLQLHFLIRGTHHHHQLLLGLIHCFGSLSL